MRLPSSLLVAGSVLACLLVTAAACSTDERTADAGQDGGTDAGVCTERQSWPAIPVLADTTFIKGPYLMYTTTNSAIIRWESAASGPSVVEYGATAALGMKASGDDAAIHKVEIAGLVADTTYHYRAGDGVTMSGVLTLRTAPMPGTPFRFAAYGDDQVHPEIHSRLIPRIAAFGASFVQQLGDAVGDGHDPAAWQLEFFDVIRPISHHIPYFLAMGNHEGNSDYWYDYMAYPHPDDDLQHMSWYSYTWGDLFVVVMDGNKYVMGTDDPQYIWLKKQLSSPAARRAKWRVAAFHQAAYTQAWGHCDYTGEERFRDTIIPLLEQKGVQMILNGHTHDYQRGTLNGVYHVISGGGGGDLEFQRCITYPWVEVENFTHHFTAIEAGCDEMTVTAIDLDGNVIDTFKIPAKIIK
ncbi:MAG: metallophosphoesterase family protein [Myxococcota bacterium]